MNPTPSRSRTRRGPAILAALLALGAAGCRTLAPPAERAPPPAPEAEVPSALRSMLNVSVTAQPALFTQPWNKSPPQRRNGFGALLPGGRVLVTAMLVSDANFVELQRITDGRRAAARVVARDYTCNLALLEPVAAGGDFFSGMVPFELDGPARAEEPVAAWQIEDDGGPMVTEGTISRIDVGPYAPSGRSLLLYRFQGTLAPRGGASILPAVRNGRLTGLFLVSADRNQPPAILPAPVIRRFLDDVQAGEPRAFPVLGIRSERTTDEALRRYLRLPDTAGGVFVSRVIRDGPADRAGLREGDVILSLDGFSLDRRRYYRDPDFGLLDFSHAIAGRKLAGETLRADIWREGRPKTLSIELSRTDAEESFVPPFLFDQGPGYIIHGGLVFTELSAPYLASFRPEAAAPVFLRYVHAYPHEFSRDKDALVVLAYMIPTPANIGYEQIRQTPVEEVNGHPIGSLRDLQFALLLPRDGLHAIRVRGPWPTIYLDAALCDEVNRRLVASGVTPLQHIRSAE